MSTPLADRFEQAWQEYAEEKGIGTFPEVFLKAVFAAGYIKGHKHGCGDTLRAFDVQFEKVKNGQ